MSRRRALTEAQAIYDQHLPAERVELRQLQRFNEQWACALERHAFYRLWRNEYDLPSRVGSVGELAAFPLLSKAIIREHEDLVFAESPRNRVYTTGGTTSEPAAFPRATNERAEQWADNYVGRAWWNLHPRERTVLVWGHSHLFGSGIGRLARLLDRRVRDAATNTLRLNAYRLDGKACQEHLRAIIRFRPRHVVGYSSAVAALARAADESHVERLHKLGLKGVVATADTLDELDRKMIEHAFGCPVIVEYGAAELGVVAVSRGVTDNIQTLWHSHLVTLDRDRGVVVSTLKRRQFPLIRYCPDDQAEPRDITPGGSILALRRVSGRTADFVNLGTYQGVVRVPVLQFTHMLKTHSGVLAVQYSQQTAAQVGLHVHRRAGADLSDIERFLRVQLKRDYPSLKPDSIVLFDEPHQLRSRSGKHLVLRPALAPLGQDGR